MMATAVRGAGAARMRNRIASYCIWEGREAIVHELGHAGHLSFIEPHSPGSSKRTRVRMPNTNIKTTMRQLVLQRETITWDKCYSDFTKGNKDLRSI